MGFLLDKFEPVHACCRANTPVKPIVISIVNLIIIY